MAMRGNNVHFTRIVTPHELIPGHHLQGFAAETSDLVANARSKLERKNLDLIVANDVSPATGIMGGTENAVHLITETAVEDWPRLPKSEVARRLALRIAEALS